MTTENKLLIAEIKDDYTAFQKISSAEPDFSTRDKNDKKMEITDLFGYFTANIIRENKTFTR